MGPLLTIEEAAAHFHKTPAALYEFCRRRPWLPVVRFGRSMRIDPVSFQDAINKRAQIDRERRERERNRRYFRRAS